MPVFGTFFLFDKQERCGGIGSASFEKEVRSAQGMKLNVASVGFEITWVKCWSKVPIQESANMSQRQSQGQIQLQNKCWDEIVYHGLCSECFFMFPKPWDQTRQRLLGTITISFHRHHPHHGPPTWHCSSSGRPKMNRRVGTFIYHFFKADWCWATLTWTIMPRRIFVDQHSFEGGTYFFNGVCDYWIGYLIAVIMQCCIN